MDTTKKDFFFHHGSDRSWRPCQGTRTTKLNVGQLHVLVTGPREASRWLWMLSFKNIYFNILSVLVLVPVPGLLWTSLNSSRRFAIWQCCITTCFTPSWKHSCVLRPRANSILIQERCSSFVNMVLERSHCPMKVNVVHTAVDWQSTVAAGCTNSSNTCTCQQSWQLSHSPSSCDSSVASTFHPNFCNIEILYLALRILLALVLVRHATSTDIQRA